LKNGNNEMQSSESHPYRISAKCVEEFMGCLERSIYGRMEIKLYYEPMQLKFVFT
jgi:hypothetical protein